MIVQPGDSLGPIAHSHPSVGDPQVCLDGGLGQMELAGGTLATEAETGPQYLQFPGGRRARGQGLTSNLKAKWRPSVPLRTMPCRLGHSFAQPRLFRQRFETVSHAAANPDVGQVQLAQRSLADSELPGGLGGAEQDHAFCASRMAANRMSAVRCAPSSVSGPTLPVAVQSP